MATWKMRWGVRVGGRGTEGNIAWPDTQRCILGDLCLWRGCSQTVREASCAHPPSHIIAPLGSLPCQWLGGWQAKLTNISHCFLTLPYQSVLTFGLIFRKRSEARIILGMLWACLPDQDPKGSPLLSGSQRGLSRSQACAQAAEGNYQVKKGSTLSFPNPEYRFVMITNCTDPLSAALVAPFALLAPINW